MHFGYNNPNFSYSMEGSFFEGINEEKDLGVIVDIGLTLDSNVTLKVSKT